MDNLGHSTWHNATKLQGALTNYYVADFSLQKPQLPEVQFFHSFELTAETSVYHSARELPSKPNGVVKTEIESMMQAHIIPPALLAWSLPVVIAAEEDEKARLRIDCPVMNQKMKPDFFPISKIRKISVELAGGAVFTTIDLFFRYWQIRLFKNCEEKTTFICLSTAF